MHTHTPNSHFCSVAADFQVALKFQSFEIENHDNCVYDYLGRDNCIYDYNCETIACKTSWVKDNCMYAYPGRVSSSRTTTQEG